MATFQKGETVRLLNESGRGIIISVDENSCTAVVELDGFEFEYPLSELVSNDGDITKFQEREVNLPTEQQKEQSHDFGQNRKTAFAYFKSESIFRRVNPKGLPEIDLHIDEITPYANRMTSGEKLEYQINYLKEAIDCACLKKVRRLIIIHGVGEGVLKTEVRKYLKSLEFAQIEDAPLKLYGTGATLVQLYGL